jgi:phospholipase D-like protein
VEDPILPGEDAMEFLTIWLFFIANVVLVVWALVDAIRVPDESMYRAGNKLIWVLVILFAGFIGAIVYLAMGRPAGTGGSRQGTPLSDQLPPPPPGPLG